MHREPGKAATYLMEVSLNLVKARRESGHVGKVWAIIIKFIFRLCYKYYIIVTVSGTIIYRKRTFLSVILVLLRVGIRGQKFVYTVRRYYISIFELSVLFLTEL